ncbi:MAG: hypothetical protein NTU49_04310 [Gammaproteobacteria bacterium]|nr:hypothetical protein [Gammaproteobacteria bacterium]
MTTEQTLISGVDQDEPASETKREIIIKLAFYLAAFSGIACFMAWTLMNNAGPLMVTTGNMDDCLSGGSGISDDSDDGVFTASCPQLSAMNPDQNWPADAIYGCIDGADYQRSVKSLLAKHCTPELMKNCVSLLANAFFSGSREKPYSKFGEYVNAYGVFCEKDTSSALAFAFILAATLALGLVVHGAVIGARLWAKPSDESNINVVSVNSYQAV